MVSIPRRTVMFGTTDGKQYLTDHTGARRIWPVGFDAQIDLDWVRENRDALFAEALVAYDLGEPFHDTLEEYKAREGEMNMRLALPAWQVRVIKHLIGLGSPRRPMGDDPGWAGAIKPDYISDVRQVLDLPPGVLNIQQSHAGAVLRRSGYESIKFSYRPPTGSPRSLYLHCHPALHAMSPDQIKAWLSQFPSLFTGPVPLSWQDLQAEHLDSATELIKSQAEAELPAGID